MRKQQHAHDSLRQEEQTLLQHYRQLDDGERLFFARAIETLAQQHQPQDRMQHLEPEVERHVRRGDQQHALGRCAEVGEVPLQAV